MNKSQIHQLLSDVNTDVIESAMLNTQNFIDIYGNDQTRLINKVETSRADVLANVYMLDVVKQDGNYIFTKRVN